MKLIAQNTTGNVATLRILDDAGVPKTGVAYNAAGLAVWYIPEGGTVVQITLTSGNWTETKFGEYEVDVPDAAYQTVQAVRIVGSLTDSVVIPDRHQVFSSMWTSLPSAATIATAVAQYDQRTQEGSPGTIGWLFKKVRQANQAIEFVITNDITPTTTTFSIDLTAYDTSAFAHSVLLMLTGTAAEDNGVILSYTDNGTYATILLEKPMANAPSVGDEGLIRADSHVHSVAEIAAGVWGATSAAYSAATGTFGYLLHVINSAIGSLSSLIQGSTVLTVASPNVRGNLVLTQGDTYDGLPGSNPKAQWTVTTDYTDGWSVTLTIRDKDDAVVYTRAGSVDSATVVSVPINVPTVSPYEGCPGVWQGKYDVQLTKSSSIKTIAIGVVYINEDQTR